jgi:hypothetical protein
MHIPKTLREIRRVLVRGGCLWATLHLPVMATDRIKLVSEACAPPKSLTSSRLSSTPAS